MSRNVIEVRIPKSLIEKLAGNEVQLNVRVIEKLREKGVPVIGAISVQGVSFGKLTVLTGSGDYVYEFDSLGMKPAVPDEEEL